MRVAPIMGITRVANVTGLDSIGVPVVMVCRPNSRSVAVSQGKGLDLAAAKASGLMEAIEGYHAETITLPLRYLSLEELGYSARVVDVSQLPTVSTSAFHGLASGNHLLEAVSHGICEIVERDATSLWKFRHPAEQDSRSVDLATIDDPACGAVLGKFHRAGLEIVVWDTTTDIGIASFFCVIFRSTEDPARRLPPAAGAGCHPSRSIALLRALTEAAQTRLTQISGSRDDAGRDTYAAHRYDATFDRVRHQLDLAKTRRFEEAPRWESDTIDADVEWELGRLRDAGVKRVVAIDLTKDMFKLPVVRMVIPGLEAQHEVPGYTPGSRARALMSAQA